MSTKVLSIVVQRASELRGLTFGNSVDDLLPYGLPQKSLTFLYGEKCGKMMNALCANSVIKFGGTAVFVDASNSADPYFVARLTRRISREMVRRVLDSIFVLRVFSPYQLYYVVARRLDKLVNEKKPHSIFVSGISSVFNEQDHSPVETERLQAFLVLKLRQLSNDQTSGVKFVVSSSYSHLKRFVSESQTVMKFLDGSARLAKSVCQI